MSRSFLSVSSSLDETRRQATETSWEEGGRIRGMGGGSSQPRSRLLQRLKDSERGARTAHLDSHVLQGEEEVEAVVEDLGGGDGPPRAARAGHRRACVSNVDAKRFNAARSHTHNPSLDPILSMRPHASWRMASTRAGVSLPALRWTSAATSAGDELRLHRVRYEKRVSIVCVLCCGPSTLRSASMEWDAGWLATHYARYRRAPAPSVIAARRTACTARHSTRYPSVRCDAGRCDAVQV